MFATVRLCITSCRLRRRGAPTPQVLDTHNHVGFSIRWPSLPGRTNSAPAPRAWPSRANPSPAVQATGYAVFLTRFGINDRGGPDARRCARPSATLPALPAPAVPACRCPWPPGRLRGLSGFRLFRVTHPAARRDSRTLKTTIPDTIQMLSHYDSTLCLHVTLCLHWNGPSPDSHATVVHAPAMRVHHGVRPRPSPRGPACTASWLCL